MRVEVIMVFVLSGTANAPPAGIDLVQFESKPIAILTPPIRSGLNFKALRRDDDGVNPN